jgi:hypothetical protein
MVLELLAMVADAKYLRKSREYGYSRSRASTSPETTWPISKAEHVLPCRPNGVFLSGSLIIFGADSQLKATKRFSACRSKACQKIN